MGVIAALFVLVLAVQAAGEEVTFKELLGMTAEPRRLEVVPGTRAHGVWLLREGEVEKNIFVRLDAKLATK